MSRPDRRTRTSRISAREGGTERGPRNGKRSFQNDALAETAKRKAGSGEKQVRLLLL